MGKSRIIGLQLIIVLLFFSVALMACGKEEPVAEAFPTPEISNMGYEDHEFEYQEQKPLLVLDSMGYGIGESKILYVPGNVENRLFNIVNTDTKETVFQGRLYRLSNCDETVCYGDFSQYDISGRYVAYLEGLGYSYEFRIGDDIYSSLYDTLYDMLKEKAQGEKPDIADECYMLSVLMLSSEIYGNNQTDWVFIDKEIEKLSQEVAKQIVDEAIGYSDYELCCLTGALAQYGDLYFDLNEEKALSITEVARQLYESRDLSNNQQDINYYALTHLYSATGDEQYLLRVDEGQWQYGDFTFLADMAYIMTERKIDFDRCDNLLKQYLDRDAEIFDRNDTIGESFSKEINGEELEHAIDELMVLGIEDYAYSGNENEIIRRNLLHYICGCNKDAENLLKSEEYGMNDLRLLSKLIFIMGIVAE